MGQMTAEERFLANIGGREELKRAIVAAGVGNPTEWEEELQLRVARHAAIAWGDLVDAGDATSAAVLAKHAKSVGGEFAPAAGETVEFDGHFMRVADDVPEDEDIWPAFGDEPGTLVVVEQPGLILPGTSEGVWVLRKAVVRPVRMEAVAPMDFTTAILLGENERQIADILKTHGKDKEGQDSGLQVWFNRGSKKVAVSFGDWYDGFDADQVRDELTKIPGVDDVQIDAEWKPNTDEEPGWAEVQGLDERKIAFSARELPRLNAFHIADRLADALDHERDQLQPEVREFFRDIRQKLLFVARHGSGADMLAAYAPTAQEFVDAVDRGGKYMPPRTLAVLRMMADPSMHESLTEDGAIDRILDVAKLGPTDDPRYRARAANAVVDLGPSVGGRTEMDLQQQLGYLIGSIRDWHRSQELHDDLVAIANARDWYEGVSYLDAILERGGGTGYATLRRIRDIMAKLDTWSEQRRRAGHARQVPPASAILAGESLLRQQPQRKMNPMSDNDVIGLSDALRGERFRQRDRVLAEANISLRPVILEANEQELIQKLTKVLLQKAKEYAAKGDLPLADEGTIRQRLDQLKATVKKQPAQASPQESYLDYHARLHEEVTQQQYAMALQKALVTVNRQINDPNAVLWAMLDLGINIGSGSGIVDMVGQESYDSLKFAVIRLYTTFLPALAVAAGKLKKKGGAKAQRAKDLPQTGRTAAPKRQPQTAQQKRFAAQQRTAQPQSQKQFQRRLGASHVPHIDDALSYLSEDYEGLTRFEEGFWDIGDSPVLRIAGDVAKAASLALGVTGLVGLGGVALGARGVLGSLAEVVEATLKAAGGVVGATISALFGAGVVALSPIAGLGAGVLAFAALQDPELRAKIEALPEEDRGRWAELVGKELDRRHVRDPSEVEAEIEDAVVTAARKVSDDSVSPVDMDMWDM